MNSRMSFQARQESGGTIVSFNPPPFGPAGAMLRSRRSVPEASGTYRPDNRQNTWKIESGGFGRLSGGAALHRSSVPAGNDHSCEVMISSVREFLILRCEPPVHGDL
ncbi:hypothetical protein Sfum_1948 [Syntrophobacter fumaroxidans MPOB]|uniref:Uncharacterized protein n=1 Tax=Syntrophobacter fumaroxidans (strain DSM 10017 / MPOB) TaxID=335543 RepID=A0LJN1_SYNFM|nr:hypothetical protein Sfum_1948 [Syntrophobacter fumaroxidans MPOB]